MAVSVVAPETRSSRTSSRLTEMVELANGLNAARAFAALLVVIFHAAIPYMISPIPMWAVHDQAQHVSVDMLIFWVNGFVMPLFFLLAGWSIAKPAAQKPFWEFAWHRLSRLGQTLLLALGLVIPALLMGWSFGLLFTERLTMSNLSRLDFPDEFRSMLGPAHLWFLEYLLMLSIAWAAISRSGQCWAALNGLVQGKWSAPVFRSTWSAVWFAIPTLGVLLVDLDTPFRLIPQFLPDLSRLLYYGSFLVAGAWLANQPQAFAILRNGALFQTSLALVIFTVLGPMTLSVFDRSLTGWERWIQTGLQAIFAWSMIFGFLGMMIRWCSKPNPWIRYGHEASFWIYLVHLPVVCIMQVLILDWPLPAWFKIFIVSASTLIFSILSYEICIRYSSLGVIINGRRIPREGCSRWQLERGWIGCVAFSVTLLMVFFAMGWNAICGNHLHLVHSEEIYRCNRVRERELEAILEEQGIRTVISLALGHENDDWFRSQRQLCQRMGVSLVTLSLEESRIPSAGEIRDLQTALEHAQRPVLLIGGKRSPTLAGFASAVAALNEGAPMELALDQFDLRFFQLEGPERCLLAQPIRAYRTWLANQGRVHSATEFQRWAEQTQLAQQEFQNRGLSTTLQPSQRQATTGAPRYPRDAGYPQYY